MQIQSFHSFRVNLPRPPPELQNACLKFKNCNVTIQRTDEDRYIHSYLHTHGIYYSAEGTIPFKWEGVLSSGAHRCGLDPVSVSFRSTRMSIIVWRNLVFCGLYWPAADLLLDSFSHVLAEALGSQGERRERCFINLHAKTKCSLSKKAAERHSINGTNVHYHSLSLLPLRSAEERQLMPVRGERSEWKWASGQQLAQQELTNSGPH